MIRSLVWMAWLDESRDTDPRWVLRYLSVRQLLKELWFGCMRRGFGSILFVSYIDKQQEGNRNTAK